jgi:hypothetical protein
MSNPFEIAAQAIVPASSSTPIPIDLALSVIRPGPKPKPLAKRKTLYALQLARRNATPIAATAEGLLAQFKASDNSESDSDSSADNDLRRRSYTREQKLAAIRYATTKKE